MIASDQPVIFGADILAAVSSRHDGNMKFGIGEEAEVIQNRRDFLRAAGIDIDHTTLVGITYNTDNFAKYRVVRDDEKLQGMLAMDGIVHADALATDKPNHALFLPLADCVGAILYDPIQRALMVSHIGRHSAEIEGAAKSVAYMGQQFGTRPADLKVWLSPGVGKASYPLHKFDGKSLHEVITEQLQAAGVKASNIEHGNIDTATSDDYYSHSEYLKGNDISGRFAVVAMMVMPEQGEPAL